MKSNILLSQNDKQDSVTLNAANQLTKHSSAQNEVDFLTNHKSTDIELILRHTTNVAQLLASRFPVNRPLFY